MQKIELLMNTKTEGKPTDIPIEWVRALPACPKQKAPSWVPFAFGASGDTAFFEKASDTNGF